MQKSDSHEVTSITYGIWAATDVAGLGLTVERLRGSASGIRNHLENEAAAARALGK
jgi:hypothetical protein